MAKLVTNVKFIVTLENLKGDIVPILKNVQSNLLLIREMSLSTDITTCLLEALQDRIERLQLGVGTHLDIHTLSQYNGQGKCREIELMIGKRHIYWNILKFLF